MAQPNSSNIVILLSREEAAAARDIFARLQSSTDDDSTSALSDESAPGISGLCELAARIYRVRRERRHFFADDLFADPAWDMLLYLYCAQASGKETSVTSLIYSAEIPQSTGLRWVQTLITCGLAARRPHPTDRRRILMTLTEVGLTQVEQYLEHANTRLFQAHRIRAA